MVYEWTSIAQRCETYSQYTSDGSWLFSSISKTECKTMQLSELCGYAYSKTAYMPTNEKQQKKRCYPDISKS